MHGVGAVVCMLFEHGSGYAPGKTRKSYQIGIGIGRGTGEDVDKYRYGYRKMRVYTYMYTL